MPDCILDSKIRETMNILSEIKKGYMLYEISDGKKSVDKLNELIIDYKKYS